MANNPYHAFLIRNRRYCYHPMCIDKLTKATQVVNVNGRDETYCSEHAQRLTAVRKSEKLQEISQ